MRRALWSIGAVLGVMIVAGVTVPSLRGLGIEPAPRVPTYVIERGPFLHRVRAEGNLKAAEATQLAPPARSRGPMRIAWMAEDGSPVAEGDVVIRFDPTDMEDDLREGRLERQKSESRIEQRSKRDAGDMANLTRDADIATLALDHAREFQSKDPDIFSRVEIIESDIDEGLAESRRSHADRVRGIREELSQVELDLLEIEKRKAEMKISQAEEMLNQLEVRAPHDGIFVLRRIWGRKPEIGQMVFGGNTVAELPRLGEMEAEVFVLEADAGGLEPGLPATIRLEADPDRIYRGEVRHVDALAKRRFRDVPVQYFTVVIAIETTDTTVMKPGSRVRADLLLGDHEDVVTVPRQAIFDEDGRTVAWVERGGTFEAVDVELGDAAPGRVVVTAGLEAGDRVALHDPHAGDRGPAETGAADGPAVGG